MRLLVHSPNPLIRAGTSALLARGDLPQPVEELDAPTSRRAAAPDVLPAPASTGSAGSNNPGARRT